MLLKIIITMFLPYAVKILYVYVYECSSFLFGITPGSQTCMFSSSSSLGGLLSDRPGGLPGLSVGLGDRRG